MADWRRDLLHALGAKPTAQNLRFLATWQRWEGGHTNNSARFNWLNTTRDAPGAVGSMNSVGVKIFKDKRSGINATAATLMSGLYDDIVKGLIKGNPYKYDLTRGLSTWVSGSPTGNVAYANKIMGRRGGAPKGSLPRGGAGASGNRALAPSQPMQSMQSMQSKVPGPGPMPELDRWLEMSLFGDDPEFMSLLDSFADKETMAPQIAAPSGPGRSGPAAPLVNAKAGGGWGGSKGIASTYADIARQHGLNITSEKRDRQTTASGGVSDHWSGSKTSYAYDLSGSVDKMDKAAKALMSAFGIKWSGGSIVQNINRGGYRIQILYRTNTGGNHYDHIHIGVRKS